MPNRPLSLRKKILLLGIVPASAICLLFILLMFNSMRRANNMVRDDLDSFMVQRTERSLLHADRSADVTYSFVNQLLAKHLAGATMELSMSGGASLGPVAPHALLSDASHVGGTVQIPTLRLGRELLDGSGRSSTVEMIAMQADATVVIFQRVPDSDDMFRLASNSPQAQIGTFLEPTDGSTKVPPEKALAAGQIWSGRSQEAGRWYVGAYQPLRDAAGAVIGAIYIGLPIDGLTELANELAANNIGSKGSVSVFYAHGLEKGKFLINSSGLSQSTQATWFPKALARAPALQPGHQDGITAHDDASGDDVIVRWSYIAPLDWVVVTVADARELREASNAVHHEFGYLISSSFFGAIVLISLVAWIVWTYTKRIVDPLLEVMVQLTSNGTQVASSARQQLEHATSFNVSSTEIATAVKQISSTSQELLRAMEDLSQESNQASSSAREGSASLRGLSQSIATLSEATHHITESLRKIRDRAARINTVTLAVTKVADRTNLLSLNAAIEAEKAGEAGAGFGVVAREVRRLADQSAQSSQEIEETIREMQTSVNLGVEQVEALTAAMTRSIEATEHIHQQFTAIISRVESMAPRYERVHIGMQNQTEGAQQISDAIWQLSESAEQTSGAITELNGVSSELHDAVRILKQRIFEGEIA